MARLLRVVLLLATAAAAAAVAAADNTTAADAVVVAPSAAVGGEVPEPSPPVAEPVSAASVLAAAAAEPPHASPPVAVAQTAEDDEPAVSTAAAALPLPAPVVVRPPELPKPTGLIVTYRGGAAGRRAATASIRTAAAATGEAVAGGPLRLPNVTARHYAPPPVTRANGSAPAPDGTGLLFVSTPSPAAADALFARLNAQAASGANGVAAVEYDTYLKILALPSECAGSATCNDGSTRYWHHTRINTPRVWAPITSADNGAKTAAVIDTGVLLNHVELQGIINTGASRTCIGGCVTGGTDLATDGHGTHCGGIIAARHNSGSATPVGVVDRGQLVSCKFMQGGTGSTSDAIACIDAMRVAGVSVMSNSWGSVGGYQTALGDAIKRVCTAGGLFIVAAGNDGRPVLQSTTSPYTGTYPAAYAAFTGFDCVLTVASTDSADALSSFSNYGPQVMIGAPGSDIFSTFSRSTTDSAVLSGTSMATPVVAGAALSLWNRRPTATAAQIKSWLVNSGSVSPTLSGRTIGGKRLDMDVAEALASQVIGGISVVAASSLCLDVTGAAFTDGTALQLWGCHGGAAQRWERLSDGSIRAVGTSKCIDISAAGTADGTKVQLWQCNGGTNQRFVKDHAGGLRPMHAATKCIDIPSNSQTAGAKLQLWTCNGSGAQLFKALMVPVTVIGNTITAAGATGLCVDVTSSNFVSGTRVQMWGCNGTPAQRWEYLSDRSVRVPGTNMCLDVNGGASADGTIVQVWTCNGSTAQKWTKNASGSLVSAVGTGWSCLDIPGGNLVQGARLQLWTCNGSAAQRFTTSVL